MKKLGLICALTVVLAAPAFADPVEGVWKTAKDDNGNFGHIKVSMCGAKICGVLVKSFDSSGAPLASDNDGKRIIWDMVPEGGGKYGSGKVWSPDRDKTYSSKMTLKGASLAIKGCVMGICRSGGKWSRVK